MPNKRLFRCVCLLPRPHQILCRARSQRQTDVFPRARQSIFWSYTPHFVLDGVAASRDCMRLRRGCLFNQPLKPRQKPNNRAALAITAQSLGEAVESGNRKHQTVPGLNPLRQKCFNTAFVSRYRHWLSLVLTERGLGMIGGQGLLSNCCGGAARDSPGLDHNVSQWAKITGSPADIALSPQDIVETEAPCPILSHAASPRAFG